MVGSVTRGNVGRPFMETFGNVIWKCWKISKLLGNVFKYVSEMFVDILEMEMVGIIFFRMINPSPVDNFNAIGRLVFTTSAIFSLKLEP